MNSARPEEAKEEWTARYEDLRRGAVEGHLPVRRSWGMTLFLRQGLVAWMHAWPREHTGPEHHVADRLVGGAVDSPEPSLSLGTQIVLVVADIILRRPREVRT